MFSRRLIRNAAVFWMNAVTVLCARYPKATELNLKGCPCVDEVVVQQAMLSLRLVDFPIFVFCAGTISVGSLQYNRLLNFFGSMEHCATMKELTSKLC